MKNIEMSRLSKYFIIICFLILPQMTKAAVLKFGEKEWNVPSPQITQSQTSAVRNTSLKSVTEHVFYGLPQTHYYPVLQNETLDVLNSLQSEVNQPVVNAELEIENNWAKVFVPDQQGRALDLNRLIDDLAKNEPVIELPLITSDPTIKLSDLNSLGITELVARGESDFSGSTKSRITNIEVGSSKYNGLILAPGEEFSFNKFLGEVDAEHGFKPEMVIKATGVTPEFGGGLCQVSSTMFRAAMNAGFPITARRNHSFAVHYYAPQGTDATIYPGVQDMKYINNLKNHVAIKTTLDIPNRKLYFDFYGTKDDRKVVFEGPIQYDKKANGAMKATWTRHVTLNGETTTQVFNSNYQPPALFQRTEVAAAPNPDAVATPGNTPEPVPAQPNSENQTN